MDKKTAKQIVSKLKRLLKLWDGGKKWASLEYIGERDGKATYCVLAGLDKIGVGASSGMLHAQTLAQLSLSVPKSFVKAHDQNPISDIDTVVNFNDQPRRSFKHIVNVVNRTIARLSLSPSA